MNRREAFEERLQREQLDLLRRHLAGLRAAQRGTGRVLPPAPSADDRALAASASPAERARVDALLCEAGYTRDDLARADDLAQASPVNDDPVDDLTRQRARVLLRGRR